jgi:hypothetical protein
MLDFSDFDTKGFAVIPNWISDADASFIASDYHNSEESDNKNQKTHLASPGVMISLQEKINEVLDAINEQTSLHVDLITPEAVYFSNQYMRPGWHQDHESFYILQQHINYLNFYIIVEKDDPLTSGISLISLDTVRDKLKIYANAIIGGGASTYHKLGSDTRVTNDDKGITYVIRGDLDDIATSPELRAGDLLLMRGDIIHKTQDGDANRLALSVRCTDGSAPIFKSKILSGCKAKKDIIAKHPQGFNYVLEKIGDKESITAFELYGKSE